MIAGSINTYSAYGLTDEDLNYYLGVLREIKKEEPDGLIRLDNGAYLSVQTPKLSPAEGRLFESHKRLIDIQYILNGTEQIEYADIATLKEEIPYSEEKDVMFFSGRGSVLTLKTGDFAVFTPTDGHLPCIGEGTVRKIVVKIPVKED